MVEWFLSLTHVDGLPRLPDQPFQVGPSPFVHFVFGEGLPGFGTSFVGSAFEQEVGCFFFPDYRQLDLYTFRNIGMFAAYHDRKVGSLDVFTDDLFPFLRVGFAERFVFDIERRVVLLCLHDQTVAEFNVVVKVEAYERSFLAHGSIIMRELRRYSVLTCGRLGGRCLDDEVYVFLLNG